ncbi:hypothetical protein N656DRAFT_204665 [Canariomyces notabilis]|uniref:C2H2-type domain-containing protein n=1 Tax=Canariomyces notabilis TaxID=2074819 RepID=A0AAN6QIS7_9PEZI|nr:hypothetical protein N656DRAFT_204665 [Canariomyces arenarius]
MSRSHGMLLSVVILLLANKMITRANDWPPVVRGAMHPVRLSTRAAHTVSACGKTFEACTQRLSHMTMLHNSDGQPERHPRKNFEPLGIKYTYTAPNCASDRSQGASGSMKLCIIDIKHPFGAHTSQKTGAITGLCHMSFAILNRPPTKPLQFPPSSRELIKQPSYRNLLEQIRVREIHL